MAAWAGTDWPGWRVSTSGTVRLVITDEQFAGDLAGCERAHARLLADVESLSDDDVGRPSLLPGWTVGNVLNHLRRNAEGFTVMARAAATGGIGDQYPSAEERAAGIERGADAPADELVGHLEQAIRALVDAWSALTPERWATGRGRTLAGEIDLRELPWRRWREVEVHHADLGLGSTWDDWPDDYVRRELPDLIAIWRSRRPMGLTDLPPAVLALSPQRRLAWLFGRISVEGVGPAGVYG